MVTALIALLAGLTGLAWVWRTRPERRRTVVGVVAAGGLGFQLVHALEHVVQAAVWVGSPDQPPFLTPWAMVGRDALAVGGDAGLGNELLHLGGNVVFLVGLVALWWAARSRASGPGPGRRALRVGVAVQGAHVVEHVVLTVTAAANGQAIGATTLFGMLEAGPVLWSLRVTARFVLNAIATVAVGIGVVALAHHAVPWSPRPAQPARR